MSPLAERDGRRDDDTPPEGRESVTVLVTVMGPDFPGVNAALFAVLAEHGAEMLDVQQATIQGRITLHVSESTVHRVLAAEGLVVAGQPAREPSPRTPWPDWLEWKPDRVWAYYFTHFTRARRTVIAILDVVSRRWITTLVAAEESSTQVEVAFTDALAAEDLLAVADTRATTALRAALACGDREQVVSLTAGGQCPLLLAISDNGPQYVSGKLI